MILLSCWDDHYQELADVTEPSKIDWCKRHGINHIVKREQGYWGKLEAILKTWKADEWIWWLDTDAKITNIEKPLIIPDKCDYVISCDINGLNAGSMLIHCVEPFKTIIAESLRRRDVYDWNNGWKDQNALAYNLWRVPQMIRTVDQKYFNSYPQNWSEGDLVLHCAGYSLPDKIRILRQSKQQ